MSSKTGKRSGSTPPARKAQDSPWQKRMIWAGGTVLVLGLVAVVFFNNPALRGVPEGTAQVSVAAPAHVAGSIYEDGEIPAGGPHADIWQNCGFYDTEIAPENAVHSLEHGAVWIAYEPGLPADQVAKLKGFTGGLDKVIVSPVAGQGSPIIVTAWANQLDLDDANDPRLAQFVNEFEGSFDAPEPGGRCTGGVGTPAA